MSQDQLHRRLRARAIAISPPARDHRRAMLMKLLIAASSAMAAVQVGWFVHIALR